jgi:hypothetical protein
MKLVPTCRYATELESGWVGILDRQLVPPLSRPQMGPEDAFLGASDPHPGREMEGPFWGYLRLLYQVRRRSTC